MYLFLYKERIDYFLTKRYSDSAKLRKDGRKRLFFKRIQEVDNL